MLLPGGEDTWWHLRVNEDNAGTIAEVVAVLVSVAAPTLRGQLATTTGSSGRSADHTNARGWSRRISPWRTLIEQCD